MTFCDANVCSRPKAHIRRGTAFGLLLAVVTLDLIGLIQIAADAVERGHRKR